MDIIVDVILWMLVVGVLSSSEILLKAFMIWKPVIGLYHEHKGVLYLVITYSLIILLHDTVPAHAIL